MIKKLVVITGSSGFLGSSIVRLLQRSDVSVIAVSRGTLSEKRRGLRYVDIDELHQLDAGFYNSITFLHLGAETSARRWENEGSLLWCDHEEFLWKLVYCASSLVGAADVRFVNASTATVVGSTQGTVSNKTEGRPETDYDAWKLRQEELVYAAARDIGASSVSLRLPNIYGRPQNRPALGRGFVTQQVERALRGHPLYYFDEVQFVRDYLHVRDAALAFVSSVNSNASLTGSQFIGTGVGTSMAQLMGLIADSVVAQSGHRPQVLGISAPSNLTALDKRSVRVDSSEFQEITGWNPQITIAHGIRMMVRTMSQRVR